MSHREHPPGRAAGRLRPARAGSVAAARPPDDALAHGRPRGRRRWSWPPGGRLAGAAPRRPRRGHARGHGVEHPLRPGAAQDTGHARQPPTAGPSTGAAARRLDARLRGGPVGLVVADPARCDLRSGGGGVARTAAVAPAPGRPPGTLLGRGLPARWPTGWSCTSSSSARSRTPSWCGAPTSPRRCSRRRPRSTAADSRAVAGAAARRLDARLRRRPVGLVVADPGRRDLRSRGGGVARPAARGAGSGPPSRDASASPSATTSPRPRACRWAPPSASCSPEQPADPWHARLVVAHSLMMALGWLGLTVTGTLVTFWPTMLRARMDDRAESLARQALPILIGGVLVSVAGALIGSSQLTALGLITYAGGLAWWGRALIAPARRSVPRRFTTVSAACALCWFVGQRRRRRGAGGRRRRTGLVSAPATTASRPPSRSGSRCSWCWPR